MIYHRGTLEKIWDAVDVVGRKLTLFLAEAKKKQNCEHNKPFFDLRSAYF